MGTGLWGLWATAMPGKNSGNGLEHVTDLGGGIFYTGRKDLASGVQIVSRRFAVVPNVDVSWKTYLATMGLRYFWQ